MSDLSTRVRLRQEQLGLSQEELARRMGYRSRSSITKLEKGINDLPQSKVEELAQALETTPAALLGLVVPGIHVENVATVAKTLPTFVDLWDGMLGQSQAPA